MKAAHARVLLTGATGGIGQAVASSLISAGASMMLAGRSASTLAMQASTLQDSAGEARVTWHATDLANPAQITTLAGVAADWDCNVVIHNAGVASFGRLANGSAEETASVLGINLVAPMLLTQSMLPHLLSQPAAQVICVGSVLGRLGLPGYSVYSASKFGLRGFAEALRRELLGTSVAVQYLGPRSTRTGFNSPQALAYNQATGTQSDAPDVVADALLKLLESRAAERFLGFPEKFAVCLNGLAPALLDSAFDKHRASLA
ncbi:SDR family oxidoreductase [Xylophilus sp. Kf1]|nr:SDR family oxidoreductase [Xylophilus sp. Kf1]